MEEHLVGPATGPLSILPVSAQGVTLTPMAISVDPDQPFHVVIGGQVNLLSLEGLDRAYQADKITEASLIWQEGFGEWLRLDRVLAELEQADDAGGSEVPEDASVGEDEFFVSFGPSDVRKLNVDQLDDFYRLEVIDDATLVWQPGYTEWIPLSMLVGSDAQPEHISVLPAPAGRPGVAGRGHYSSGPSPQAGATWPAAPVATSTQAQVPPPSRAALPAPAPRSAASGSAAPAFRSATPPPPRSVAPPAPSRPAPSLGSAAPPMPSAPPAILSAPPLGSAPPPMPSAPPAILSAPPLGSAPPPMPSAAPAMPSAAPAMSGVPPLGSAPPPMPGSRPSGGFSPGAPSVAAFAPRSAAAVSFPSAAPSLGPATGPGFAALGGPSGGLGFSTAPVAFSARPSPQSTSPWFGRTLAAVAAVCLLVVTQRNGIVQAAAEQAGSAAAWRGVEASVGGTSLATPHGMAGWLAELTTKYRLDQLSDTEGYLEDRKADQPETEPGTEAESGSAATSAEGSRQTTPPSGATSAAPGNNLASAVKSRLQGKQPTAVASPMRQSSPQRKKSSGSSLPKSSGLDSYDPMNGSL